MVLEELVPRDLMSLIPPDLTDDRRHPDVSGIFIFDEVKNVDTVEATMDRMSAQIDRSMDWDNPDRLDKRFIIPLNGGIVPLMHYINHLNESGRSSEEINNIYENIYFTLGKGSETRLIDWSGEAVKVTEDDNLVVIDDIADTLGTFVDVSAVSSLASSIEFFAPTAKKDTILNQLKWDSQKVEERTGVAMDIDFTNCLNIVTVFPDNRHKDPIWIAAGAGMNRGYPGDGLYLQSKQRFSNVFYYSRPLESAGDRLSEDEIYQEHTFLDNNLIDIATFDIVMAMTDIEQMKINDFQPKDLLKRVRQMLSSVLPAA